MFSFAAAFQTLLTTSDVVWIMNSCIKLMFPPRLTLIKRLLGCTEIMQCALEVGVTVWSPQPAVRWETICDSESHLGGWFPFGPRGIPIYKLLPSHRLLPSLHWVSTDPSQNLSCFYPCSPLAGCSFPGLFAPLPQCTRLYISASCSHSFRQKTSPLYMQKQEVRRLNSLPTNFKNYSRSLSSSLGCDAWAGPRALTGAGGTPGNLGKSWIQFVPRQTLAASRLHAPGFVLPPMTRDAHWISVPGTRASSRPTFHTYLLLCVVKSWPEGRHRHV